MFLDYRPFQKARFTEFLIRENGLYKCGFKGWFFHPGMLFQATDKWWGDKGTRHSPHEGLDLCLYTDQANRVVSLGEHTKIPAIYDGVVARMVDDFLGKSIMIEHVLSNGDNSRLYTFYGHTTPGNGLHVGKTVKEGEIIATLALPVESRTDISAHLHISLGWASEAILHNELDWDMVGDSKALTLLDPLPVIQNDPGNIGELGRPHGAGPW